MADKCLPPADKKYKATKAEVSKSLRASSTDRMAALWTHTDVHRESSEAKCPSR